MSASVQAAVAVVILVAVFTVGPYLIAKQSTPTAPTGPVAPATAADKSSEPSAGPTADPATPAEPPATPAAGPAEVLNKLGENTTKPASPNVNPLDKKGDDLFNELIGD